MPIMDWVRGVWMSQDQRPVPEFMNAVFAKTSPKHSKTISHLGSSSGSVNP